MNGVPLVALLGLALSMASPAGAKAPMQPPDSTMQPPCVEWKLAALSPVIRDKIHLRAKDVPPLPHEDPRLRDPKAWPGTTRIGGSVCSLRVEALLDGRATCHSYECAPWRGDRSRRGSSFCWLTDESGTWLEERSWIAPDSLRSMVTIQEYRSGELLKYGSRNEGLSEWFTELFDRSGCLVACGYSKLDGAGARTTACYFLGTKVGYREFEDRVADFLTHAFR
jgi:hypothetical protein